MFNDLIVRRPGNQIFPPATPQVSRAIVESRMPPYKTSEWPTNDPAKNVSRCRVKIEDGKLPDPDLYRDVIHGGRARDRTRNCDKSTSRSGSIFDRAFLKTRVVDFARRARLRLD